MDATVCPKKTIEAAYHQYVTLIIIVKKIITY